MGATAISGQMGVKRINEYYPEEWKVRSPLSKRSEYGKEKSERVQHKFFPQKSRIIKKQAQLLRVELEGEWVTSLPLELYSLFAAIEKSKYIVNFVDRSEEEPIMYEKEVWIKSIKFLANLCNSIFELTGNVIDSPKIYDGPEGSIDILWKNDSYRLLLNIPKEPGGLASYYGDNFGSGKSEGTFIPSKENPGLTLWPLLLQ